MSPAQVKMELVDSLAQLKSGAQNETSAPSPRSASESARQLQERKLATDARQLSPFHFHHQLGAHSDSNHWHWLHYQSRPPTNSSAGAANSIVRPQLHDYDDGPTAISAASDDADVRADLATDHSARQRELLDLFARRFKLDSIGAKIWATNAKIYSLPLRQTRNRTLDSNAGLESAKLAPHANSDHLAQLSCDSAEMIVRLNFSEPFKGIVYPDHNRLSPCRFFGDGHLNYELRLPLRGCGTRQVATRVFVNDVIVRFHKTLELEEDEVKTLICRYPAPLDSGASAVSYNELAAGQGLVHELERSPAGNRTQLLEPFEFVDSNGKSTTTLTTGLNAPETLGELRHHQSSGSPNQELDQRQRLNLLLAGSDNFRPRAPTLELSRGEQNSGQSSAANFLERLTSVELLFLISSLMFLVLLTLGLAASYFCFWRQRRRRLGHVPRPGALFRKRRYFNAPLGGGVAGAATHPHQHSRPALYYHHYLQQQQQQQTLSPSSPDDSDVSGQELLPGTTAGGRGATSSRHAPPLIGGRHLVDGGETHYKSATTVRHQLAPVAGRRHELAGQSAAFKPANSTLGRRGQAVERTRGGYLSSNMLAGVQYAHKPRTLGRAPARESVPGASAEPHSQKLHRLGPLLRNRESRSMQQLADEDELLAWNRHQERLDQFRVAGSREPGEGVTGPPQPRRSFHAQRQSQRADDQQGDRLVAVETSSSDCEAEPNDEATGAREKTRRPRLILKSIEDSFVTNVTEIHEQEFAQFDSRRPLSWAEWSSAAVALKRRQSGGARSDSSGSGHSSPGARVEQANLRSLTEVDVSYAKSLPRRPAPKGPAGGEEPNYDDENNDNSDKQVSKVEVSAASRPAESSPDLIISPDYNFGRFRLIGGAHESADEAGETARDSALVGAAGGKRPTSAQSHESISYV